MEKEQLEVLKKIKYSPDNISGKEAADLMIELWGAVFVSSSIDGSTPSDFYQGFDNMPDKYKEVFIKGREHIISNYSDYLPIDALDFD